MLYRILLVMWFVYIGLFGYVGSNTKQYSNSFSENVYVYKCSYYGVFMSYNCILTDVYDGVP